LNVDLARRQFPHTWTDIVYLNHAAVSPLSFRVRDAVDAYLTKRALKGIEPYPWAIKMLLETKDLIAQVLHTQADRIAMVLNTGDGLNILANGLPWKDGDRVLLNTLEFPANIYPFLNLEKRGVRIDYAEAHDGNITLKSIQDAITPETRLVSLSLVQYLTGGRTDVQAIGEFCKERGVVFAVDAIQSLPHCAMDVERSHVDFLSCGSHKWLMAPEGTGFIYVSESMQERLTQSNLGWTSVSDAFNFQDLDPNRLRTDAGRYEGGMLNYPGVAGLKASLQFFFEFGLHEMERQTLSLSSYLIDRLGSRGVEVITPKQEASRSAIVSFRMDDAEAVHKRLMDKQIILSLRAGRDGIPYLRAAPHFYNTEEEMRKLFIALFD
jgi:cysteine desulfurase / selenocysteine lyase